MSLPDYAKIAGGFRTMSLAEFKKICLDIKEGGRLKVLRFYFVGEPLLNPNLPEMIAMACQIRLAERTELTTNGVLLNEEKSRAIINSGIDYLRISISSVDPSRHKHLTQSNIRVKSIYENIKRFRQIRNRLKRKKPFLYVKMIDSLTNEENTRFLKMYQSVGDEVEIEKPMNWDDYGNHDLLQAAYGEEKKTDPTECYPYPKSVCPFPFYTLLVNADGDVTVCCVDWNKATKVGNAFESPLKAIWDGDAMRDFRRMHILRKRRQNPSCARCKFLFTVPDNLDNMPESKIKAIIGTDKKRKKR
jgi:radical SAM protein with 4Fe4S-binding SPASM domain